MFYMHTFEEVYTQLWNDKPVFFHSFVYMFIHRKGGVGVCTFD